MLMHHPKLQVEKEFPGGSARVWAKAGWKEGPLPKPRRRSAVSSKATEQKEQTDG